MSNDKHDPRSILAELLAADRIERINALLERAEAHLVARGAGTPGLLADPVGLVEHAFGQYMAAAEQPAQPEADPKPVHEDAETEIKDPDTDEPGPEVEPEPQSQSEEAAPESRDEAPRRLEAPAPRSRTEAPGTPRTGTGTADRLFRILWELYENGNGPYSTFERFLDALTLGIIAAKRGEPEVEVEVPGSNPVPIDEYFDDVLSAIPCPRTQMLREADGSAIAAPAPRSPRADRLAEQDVVDQDQDQVQDRTEVLKGVTIPVGTVRPRGGYVHCRPRREILAEALGLGIPAEVIHHKDLLTARQKPSARATPCHEPSAPRYHHEHAGGRRGAGRGRLL